MPVVPVYTAPQAAPAELPGVRFEAGENLRTLQNTLASDAGGVRSLGAGMMNAGAALSRIVAENQADINEAATKEAFNVASSAAETMLNDPKEGFLAKQGKDALDPTSVKKGIQQAFDSAGQGLTNDRQRLMFQQAAAARMVQYAGVADKHAMDQGRVYNNDQDNAFVQGQGQTAIGFKDDDKLRTQALNTGIATIQKAGERNGLPQEMIDQNTKKFTSVVVGEIVKNYITEGRAGAAKTFFENNIGLVTEDRRDEIRAQVKQATDTDDEATAYRALQTSGGGYQAQLKSLQSAFDTKGSIGGVQIDGKKFFQLRTLLEQDKSRAEANESKYISNILGQAQTWAIQNPEMTILDYKKQFPQQYAAIERKGHVGSLDAAFKSLGETDPTAMFNLRTNFGMGGPMDLTQMPADQQFATLMKMAPRDRATFESALQGHNKAIKDPESLPLKEIATTVSNRLSQIGLSAQDIPKGAAGDAKREQMNAVFDFVQKEVLQAQITAGHRFKSDEIGNVIDGLFAKNIEFNRTLFPGGGGPTLWSSTEPMFKTTVPDDKAKVIKQWLIDNGTPNPSNRDILFQYWKRYGR